MKKYPKIMLLGFSLWLIPFIVSVLIFPLRAFQRPLFESIMPLVITIWTVFFSIIYFTSKNLSVKNSSYLIEGATIGFAWLFISIFLDMMIFIGGPLEMPIWDYAKDIAVTYLMIPTITTGFGYLLDKRGKIIEPSQ